ncbi:uncharacterized protein DS421_17g590970 [Arachis hypogaea]|nr:uncharacterized protein DS421_17g590970 [Arachis hypogaea]
MEHAWTKRKTINLTLQCTSIASVMLFPQLIRPSNTICFLTLTPKKLKDTQITLNFTLKKSSQKRGWGNQAKDTSPSASNMHINNTLYYISNTYKYITYKKENWVQ